MNFRYFLLNVFLQIFICKNEDEEAQNILFHLKPNVFENQTSLATGIDNLLKKVNSHFNESNITSFYETLTSDGDASSLALSVYHNWGLGVFEDPRIAVLHLNLGVLQEDQLALLSYNYKSLFGINVPKTCQANLDSLKSVTNEVARNFSLFERKEGSLIYINKEMEGAENQIIGEVLANLDEISRSNPKQLNNLFEIYLSSSLSKTPEATEKIFAYLEKSYRFTQSHEIAAYLGLLYLEKGNIHEVNYEKALGYLEIARAARIPHAYLGLGIIYFYGLGVNINYNLSFEFFVKANKSGRIEANTYLGISYLAGLGVTPNTKMALNHIMTAANKGFLLALYVLGFMHEKGIGVFHSCKYATEAYSIIIEHKLLKTYVSQAVKDYNQGYRLRAFYKLLLFSEMGSTYSLLNAAHIAETDSFYFYTLETQRKNAFKLWKYAADLGNPKATIKVGDYYFYGIGVDQDYKNAFENYHTAAIGYQDAEALFNLGYMYEYGLGVNQNYKSAERFYGIASQFETGTKIFISLVLLKLRIKTISDGLKNNIKYIHIVSQTIFKNFINIIVDDYETIFIVCSSILVVFLTRNYLNQ